MSDTEQAIIVDAQDKVITYVDRDSIPTGSRFRMCAVWIESPEGLVLVQQRTGKLENPHKFSNAAGGLVAKGSDYRSAAAAELFEEIGVRTELEFLGVHEVAFDDGIIGMCGWFNGVVPRDTEFQIAPEEVEEVVWMPKDELPRDSELHPEQYDNGSQCWQRLFG